MPKSLDEVETGPEGPDLYFASQLEEREQPLELRLHEYQVYEAEEVRDEIDDMETPSYGDWIPVQDAKTGTEERAFCQAPAELIQEIQDADIQTGDTFKITRCQKAGPEDHAPYQVNVEVSD
jgi:hypothetical protein